MFLIGPFGVGQLPESFARAFERLGFDVVRYDSDRAYFDAHPAARNQLIRRAIRPWLWRKMNAETLDLIRSSRPVFALAVKGTYLHAETIHRVRRELGVPFVNYYSDNPYCGVPWNPRKSSTQRRDLLQVLGAYTKVWIWEEGMADRLRADGVTAAYLPFGVDSELFQASTPAACAECGTNHEVVFVGQHSDKRERHLDAIRRHAAGLWGSRWHRAAKRFGGRHQIHTRPAFGTACAKIYAGAEVALNVVDDLNMPGHNMRTFEIPASGGLMLSSYTDDQAALFPQNEAALYYRDPAELDDQLDRVLGDKAWAARLRANAAAIAVTHDYRERAKVIAADLDR